MIKKEYVFKLDEDEYNVLEKWWNENFKNEKFGTIGGGLTFEITPTSIGEIVVARCHGKEIILRDL